MYTSNLLANATTLQGKAGSLAINSGDLLSLNSNAQLFSAKTSDFAAVANIGAAAIANTTVVAQGITGSKRKMIWVNPADSTIYVATSYLSGDFGTKLFRYSPSGVLLQSIILDTTSDTLASPIIAQLSNGNLLVTFIYSTGFIFGFAIVDLNLNIVKTSTSISGTAQTAYYDVIALSGGGFAVCFIGTGGNPYLTIFNNAGTSTFAVTVITGAPSSGVIPKLAQLSNGNIVAGICSQTAAKFVAYYIFSTAGASVVAYTVLSSTGSASISSQTQMDFAVISGFFCFGAFDGLNNRAFVVSNAGALQGAGYSKAGTTTALRVLTDGSNFWMCHCGTAGYVTYVPVTGTNYVDYSVATTSNNMDAAIENNFIIFNVATTNVYIYPITAAGILGAPLSFAPLNSNGGFVALMGDNAILLAASGSGTTTYVVQKYLNASIVGVSQVTLAAGNANTLLQYAMGPGGYPINSILGSVGKTFDHTASNIVANKGVLLGAAVSLRGI